jgi:hypothetical protein
VGPTAPLVVKKAVNAAKVVDVNILNISKSKGSAPTESLEQIVRVLQPVNEDNKRRGTPWLIWIQVKQHLVRFTSVW